MNFFIISVNDFLTLRTSNAYAATKSHHSYRKSNINQIKLLLFRLVKDTVITTKPKSSVDSRGIKKE